MSSRYRFGPFELDAAEHSLRAHGRPVTLTHRAFDTLLYLVCHPGRLVTRDELIGAVWGEAIVEEGNLHWTISAVRRALAQESAETFIETARGLGYRFLAPVEVVADSPAEAPASSAAAPEEPLVSSRAGWRLWLAAGLAVLLLTGLAWTVAGRRHTAASSKAAVTSGAMPAAAPARRLYTEGLEWLRRRDALAAVERLEAAVAADPASPDAWLALAQAYELLGSVRRAEDAALKAMQRSNGRPERQRLSAEAAYLRIARRQPEAADRLRRLYELSRHAFEDGLALAETQAQAGQTQEALATIAELRREHPDARDDARLIMLETDIFQGIEDYPQEIVAARKAVVAAHRQGMIQIEVRALQRLARTRLRTGSVAECGRALDELALARRKAEATGDRFLLAGVLQELGNALFDCTGSSSAEQAYREAIELYREVGALGKLPAPLYNLGSVRLKEGDLLEADRFMREALETCQAHGILCRERFLHPIGVNRMHRGELAEARRMVEEGIRLNRQLGNRNRVAEAQSFLPDLAGWSGDLAQAVELQRQVLALRQEIGVPNGIAWAHSDLAAWLAESGRGAEALEHARQAAALAVKDGETSLVAYSRASLALAHRAAGDLAAADRESARAVALLHPPRLPFASFYVWRIRAQVLLERGQLAAAEASIDEGLELARRSGMATYELEGRRLRAELALARGQSWEARRLASELAAEARAKGFGLIAQRCETVIAQANERAARG
jgi:DNA-binding winged helix-turn-helix (wHTH) protein